MTKNYEKLTKYYKERKGVAKEENKLEKSKLNTRKFEVKQKEKRSKKIGKLLKGLSKPITSRRIMKKGQMQVHIPNREIPSVLNDENRFFKGELNKEKRSLYFS